jgi:hypothetical protein
MIFYRICGIKRSYTLFPRKGSTGFISKEGKAAPNRKPRECVCGAFEFLFSRKFLPNLAAKT